MPTRTIKRRRRSRRKVAKPVVIPQPTLTSVTENKYGGKSRQLWWENRFPKVPVIYNAQDKSARDVRNFIFDKSCLFDKTIRLHKLNGNSDDDTVYRCCMFVQDRIRYIGDTEARNQAEFWQYPEDTLTRGTGDCEDGAILMKSLTLATGVPDWKVKVQAGMVKGGGHAYCTYIRDDDTQCVLDWCYWSNRLPVSKRRAFKDEPNYYDIWFSFNKEFAYAETKLSFKVGNIKPTV